MNEIRTITKYGQVKKLLKKRLKHLSPHQSLSSEPRLAEECNVSRFTVSKAISELSAEGLLYRIQGKGTFVSPKKPSQRTGLIGLLARELDKPYIWGEVAKAVEEEAGLNVPKDIGLVGFDDSDIAYKLKIPLTTVRQPREEMGKRAVQLLRKRIENPDKKAERIVLSAKLIIRESSVKKNGK